MKVFLAIRRCVLYLALSGLMIVGQNVTQGQEIRVSQNVPASPVDGWHAQYEMHIDPDNSNNMLLCGFRFSAKDDAFYGYVYLSSDQGKSWKLVLEPKNSTFESEESCAYGVHGVAYYVTSASKVTDGEIHHDQGTTRIYVSRDSGRTWSLGVKTGWNDFSTSVVDTAPGANQNRLYAFFNGNDFYRSLGQPDAADAGLKQSNKTGSWVALISYKDGDAQVAGPFVTQKLAQQEYTRGGSFPSPALRLNDGSMLVIYTTTRRSDKNVKELITEAARTLPDRRGLEEPVKIVSSLDNADSSSDIPCGSSFMSPAATYDAMHDRVYFAFSGVRDKRCELLLTSSTDGGRSWSKPQPIRASSDDSEQTYADPAIAVNRDGLIALMWQKAYRAGCWMFSISSDEGKSRSRTTSLGTCAASEIKPSKLDTAFLWDSFSQATPNYPNSTAHITLRNSRNNILGRNQDAIAVTPDGIFHPVWSDSGSGKGELRTASIQVTSPSTLISASTVGLVDVTNKVKVLYGGDQAYDAKSRLITLEVVFENSSDQPLNGPFKLVVPNANDGQFAEIANADNHVPGGGAVWDVSSSVPGGRLDSGATSKPFVLRFRYFANEDKLRVSDNILGVSLKVFAAK